MPKIRRELSAVLLGALCTAGCPGDDNFNTPPVSTNPGTTGTPPVATGSGSGSGSDSGTSGTSGSSSSTAAADGTGTSTTGGPLVTCEELQCSGFGTCEIGKDGNAACVCDPYYVLDGATNTCVVDETCVRVRYLQDDCRQIINGPPAVSLFFGVDFCAGSAVTPIKLADNQMEIVVLENGVDVTENVESDATIIPTSVESYVTLVIDVSDSVFEADLSALVAELRNLVTELQPLAGDPDVYVSIFVFGETVREYVPFTRDLAAVDTALAQIETDPNAVISLVGGAGTALYDAVAMGIKRTERIRELRKGVSWGGVLTTGTVVVITDGYETTGATLDMAQIADTSNQVISIGISGEVIDGDLDIIGRDGSFLAPLATDWPVAFAEVATRVDEYPDRSYLLAYCSSTNIGMPTVEVTVTAPGPLTVEQTAECTFNADFFSSDVGQVCNQDLFLNECATQECGGLTACGACADDQCCNGSSCQAPVSADDVGLTCDGDDQLCNATNEICTGSACEPPELITKPCGAGCEPGVAYCDAGVCVAALPEGAVCDPLIPQQCASLHCRVTNPLNPFEPPICQPPALMFDTCGDLGAATVCEGGSYCDTTVCVPPDRNLEACSFAYQCRSGSCEAPLMTSICVDSGACFWAWDEKVP